MIVNSSSPDSANNKELKRVSANPQESNSRWLKRVIKSNGFEGGGLLLLGGNSVVDFRVRVAQSHLRHDLTPSYWSAVAITPDYDRLYSVPLQWMEDLSEMPHANGITVSRIADFDDPVRFPNIAIIQFADSMTELAVFAERLKIQRNVIDLPSLVVAWLSYVWAVGDSTNPLSNGQGLPSAVFAETVFGIGGIEITPGLATQSSCPEAIWQAAKWWSAFYKEVSKIQSSSETRGRVPKGCFALRQPAAAVYEPPFKPRRKPAARKKRRT
jgi:hypothetical protein